MANHRYQQRLSALSVVSGTDRCACIDERHWTSVFYYFTLALFFKTKRIIYIYIKSSCKVPIVAAIAGVVVASPDQRRRNRSLFASSQKSNNLCWYFLNFLNLWFFSIAERWIQTTTLFRRWKDGKTFFVCFCFNNIKNWIIKRFVMFEMRIRIKQLRRYKHTYIRMKFQNYRWMMIEVLHYRRATKGERTRKHGDRRRRRR